ncbi:hypothetical protein [Kitasatospora sp. NPDC056531]|uniref:hypothetical protein n=1 Tax=Kitasatospora sp. NPDC056531 TaxID=3345856 RepID=UPI0036B58D52
MLLVLATLPRELLAALRPASRLRLLVVAAAAGVSAGTWRCLRGVHAHRAVGESTDNGEQLLSAA